MQTMLKVCSRGRVALISNATTTLANLPLGAYRTGCPSQLVALHTVAAAFVSRPPPAPAGLPHPRSVSCRSYAAPEVYDIAFSFRDFEAEVAFLLEAYKAHCTAPLTRFLDVGCGPARHAALLVSAAGVQALGLDSSPEMIQYATERAQREGLHGSVQFVHGDMAAEGGFVGQLPGGPVDLAACMLGTLAHCLDNAAALRFFHNLAAAVRPGGLLVLELPHPEELFDGTLLSPDEFSDCWEAEEKEGGGSGLVASEPSRSQIGGKVDPQAGEERQNDGGSEDGSSTRRRVLVEYGREGDEFDAATQVLQRTVGLSLFDPDGAMVSSCVEVVPQRQFGLQEVDLLGRAAGFEVVGVGGDLAMGVDLGAEGAYRMVVCLRRSG